jgi:hypothetical protein
MSTAFVNAWIMYHHMSTSYQYLELSGTKLGLFSNGLPLKGQAPGYPQLFHCLFGHSHHTTRIFQQASATQ